MKRKDYILVNTKPKSSRINFGSGGITYSKKAMAQVRFHEKKAVLIRDAQNTMRPFSEIIAIATAKNIKELNKAKTMNLLTPEHCLKVFGDPRKAEAKWCVVWNAPKDIVTCIPTIPKRIYMNKIAVPYWTAVYRELCEKKLGNLVKTWDGWFNIRKQRGSDQWSIHSWGLGPDLNASTNPQGKKPTMDPRVVKVFEDNGFNWGGRFKGKRVDGMHFELSKEMVDDYLNKKPA